MVMVTSKSLSPTLLAPTLIWMLICGGWVCGASEDGAFGFSNDRSLVYCASTLSWGGGAASGGAPLPLVMGVSPGAFTCEREGDFASEMPVSGRVANIAPPHSTRTTSARRRPAFGPGGRGCGKYPTQRPG